MKTYGRMGFLLVSALAVCSGVILPCSLAQDTSAKAQVRVVDVIWGFDGRVSAGHFQPLSLLLDNLSGEVLEGKVFIRHPTTASREQRGAILEQPIYLGARSRRWVQFYPYVSVVPDMWDVYLETEAGRIAVQSLDPPRLAADASRARLMGAATGENSRVAAPEALPAVFLDPPRNQDRFPTAVRHMPAEIFPPYSTATGGLYAVFLDHVPDWEEPRQQAFLSWLKSGGRLHLLLDSNGRELQFPGLLSVLNEPSPEFRLSSGRVIREDLQRQGLSEDRVKAVVLPKTERDALADVQQAFQVTGRGTEWQELLNDDDLFSRLRLVVEPRHAWSLIGLLSLVYVGALYPGIWRFSSSKHHSPLKTIGAVLGLSAVFSLLFLWLGRRGYGETQSVLTYMVASAEDDQHWDCLQFSQLFATDGGNFELTSEGQQSLMSAGTQLERSDGVIQSGNSASLKTRLAPYSTEAIRVQRRLQLPDWKAGVVTREITGGSLARLQLRLGPDFPFEDNPVCLAVVGRTICELRLNRATGAAELAGSGTSIDSWLARQPDPGLSMLWSIQDAEAEPVTEEQVLRSMLLRRCLATKHLFVGDVGVSEDSVLLLVHAKLPEAFRLKWNPEVPEDGEVLYMKLLPVGSGGPG